ncbi:preprotein translocase subunit SecD [Loktanella fryxellensis]|uniref:Protein translocase subunit SecD n=1 Tax=Loktanella fryxellensis TaxID=245187 RepID=A0A1H8BHI3_9RHOB|nr:protein translocase subunit SecD [Loktanella fryxellensis]SEM81584.1 preprotein translocase subunit SecD [Loktanella fryxellensis]
MYTVSPMKQIAIWLAVAIGLAFALPNAFYSRVEVHNDAVAQGIDDTSWPAFLPSGLVNLGLDLRGGAHLLAEVQVGDVYETIMEATWPAVRDALAAERDTVGFVTREPSPADELIVRISEPAGAARALEIARGLARPITSLTGAGSTDIEVTGNGPLLTIRLSEAERAAVDDRTMEQSLEIIRRRIDEVGTREPTIQRQGEDRILVQVPGVGSAQEIKNIIGTTAQLTFQPVLGRASGADQVPAAGQEVLPSLDQEGVFFLLDTAPVVTGEQLVDAQPAFDEFSRPAVNFRFNVSGARAFGDYTLDNIGQPFAIVLDEQVISAPTIQSHIPGGSGIITGDFTVEESTNLAVLLRAGALPAELTFLEERTIGPQLGQDSIDAGTLAAIVAGVLVVGFMVLCYGLFGIFASVALAINIALIFSGLSLLGATLTLPGIAGIVLTVGMAVDANVLVFERIREELRVTKIPARAINAGYDRALSAITDGNVTTIMVACILFYFGSGPVRGFAVTLALGTLISVFTALMVTRSQIDLWVALRRPKTIEV